MYKINILCIDDNKNNLFTLSSLLEKVPNVDVVEALSGMEGLRVLLKQRIDLILLDIQMPQMNGFEFAKLVKSNKETKDIPIIFITAVFKQKEFQKEGFDIGAIDYLTKPIDDNQLINKISLYTKLFEQNNRLKSSSDRFYNIAQSIGNGIYVLDKEFKVIFINNRGLELLNYQKSELMGKKIHDIIHYKDRNNTLVPSYACPIHKSLKLGEVYRDSDAVLVKKDGTFLYVSIVSTPLVENEDINGTVVYFKDMTGELEYKKLQQITIKAQVQFIDSLVDMIEARDSYTAGHTKRVAEYCTLIAKNMGYSKKELELLRQAAVLHDIGKISTPDSILLKPTKLTKLEYKLIQEHVQSGYDILTKIDSYKKVADIIYQHHERFDGSGYPIGLKDGEIEPLSRIMMVADSFDAMTTDRVYKGKKSVVEALDEIRNLSAISYHPEVVKSALEVLNEITVKENTSQLPSNDLEKERFTYFYKDRLTHLFDIDYLFIVLRYYIQNDKIYTYFISLKNFSSYNDRFGWDKGDRFLERFAMFLKKSYRDTYIFRVEGDDFLIISEKIFLDVDKDIKSYKYFRENRDLLSYTIKSNMFENIGAILRDADIKEFVDLCKQISAL